MHARKRIEIVVEAVRAEARGSVGVPGCRCVHKPSLIQLFQMNNQEPTSFDTWRSRLPLSWTRKPSGEYSGSCPNCGVPGDNSIKKGRHDPELVAKLLARVAELEAELAAAQRR